MFADWQRRPVPVNQRHLPGAVTPGRSVRVWSAACPLCQPTSMLLLLWCPMAVQMGLLMVVLKNWFHAEVEADV